MKRALIVGTGTIVGVGAVLGLNPEGGSSGAGLAPTSASTPHTATTGATKVPGKPIAAAVDPTASASATAPKDSSQSVQGTAIDVGFGIVQVEITVTAGRLVDITALSLPQSDRHSARISQQAFPMLVTQALAAQSAQIAGVSGASYTSSGFVESLKAALIQAGHAA
jgi:uncharacterized protein with FMN-binding domain